MADSTDVRAPVTDPVLDILFRKARSQNGYLPKPVDDSLLEELYDLAKWGPTSTNCQPARYVFIRSEDAKRQLVACAAPSNAPKILAAPVTVIIGMETHFVDSLERLFPHVDVRPMYRASAPMTEATAFRNSSLQGAYLMLAARSLGLDCGPMSGFDPAAVDAAFWQGTSVRTNFLCTLGYGDPDKLFPRLPRLDFTEVCRLV